MHFVGTQSDGELTRTLDTDVNLWMIGPSCELNGASVKPSAVFYMYRMYGMPKGGMDAGSADLRA